MIRCEDEMRVGLGEVGVCASAYSTVLIGLGQLRLGLGSGRDLWEICQVTFMHAQKKNQVTSFGCQQRDNIYICIFNSFSYIYMNLKSLVLQYKNILVLNKKAIKLLE